MPNTDIYMTENTDKIQEWASQRDLVPVVNKNQKLELRSSANVEPDNILSWTDVRNRLKKENKAFVYQNNNENGETSHYYLFAPRDSYINQQTSTPESVDYSQNIKGDVVR